MNSTSVDGNIPEHRNSVIQEHNDAEALLPDSERQYPREIAEIQRLFALLRTPPAQPNAQACSQLSGVRMRGWLFSSGFNTLHRSWKRRWCVLGLEPSRTNPGIWKPSLTFQRAPDSDQSFRRTFNYLTVSLLTDYQLSRPDPIYRRQFSIAKGPSSVEVLPDATPEHAEAVAAMVSRHRFHLWCANQTVILSPDSDAEADAWVRAFEEILRASFSPEEIRAKSAAASAISPILERQRQLELRRYQMLRANFRKAGFGDIMPNKQFEGNLRWFRDDAPPGGFRVHLVLYKRSVTIAATHRADPPFGFISLRYMLDVRLVPGKPHFVLTTPLTNFLFAAKHAASAEAWVFQLHYGRRSRMAGSEIGEAQKMRGSIYYGTKRLVPVSSPPSSSSPQPAPASPSRSPHSWFFKGSGVGKKYRLKEGETIIGRSQSNQIRLNDTHISRNHLKILNFPGQPVILCDLGSQHGTLVNSQRVSVVSLQNQDLVQLGRLAYRFVVDPHPHDVEDASPPSLDPMPHQSGPSSPSTSRRLSSSSHHLPSSPLHPPSSPNRMPSSPPQSPSTSRRSTSFPQGTNDQSPLLRIEDSEDEDDDAAW